MCWCSLMPSLPHTTSADSSLIHLARKVDVRRPGKVNSKLPWRKAGPPNRHDDEVDSDQ